MPVAFRSDRLEPVERYPYEADFLPSGQHPSEANRPTGKQYDPVHQNPIPLSFSFS